MIYVLLLIICLVIFYNKKGLPIFLYHQVNHLSNVNGDLFEEHLKILKNKKMKTITLSEYGEGKTPKNSILLTLDDGYYDNYKNVFPLLKKYNMKATIFLNTLYIGNERENTEIEISGMGNYKAMKNYVECGNGITDQYMTWDEIKEMSESGLVDFQCHSHKHVAIFKDIKLEGFFKGDEKDSTDMYLYGEVKEGYPKFPKRGEYSGPGIIIKRKFFDIFREYYIKTLKELDEKEAINLGNKFIEENKNEYFIFETESDFENRIKKELLLNKNLIEKNLNKKVQYFCWPWGHRSKKAIEIMEKMGIKGFITTKKGTNSYNPNWKMIRRIELRKYTVEKFKINLFLGRNLILGKIYGWVS